jgi:predicted aspartyl protease
MPHFTLSLDPARGPVVNAAIGVSEGRRNALTAANQAVPGAQSVRALIDTGASFTSVDPGILANLGLTPTGTMDVVTPSTGQGVHTTNTYDVDFAIGASPQEVVLAIPNLRIAAAELFLMQGIHVLIGRDVLSLCLFAYNGATQSFTLAY